MLSAPESFSNSHDMGPNLWLMMNDLGSTELYS
jgi:hypothetical protein